MACFTRSSVPYVDVVLNLGHFKWRRLPSFRLRKLSVEILAYNSEFCWGLFNIFPSQLCTYIFCIARQDK